MANSDCTGNDGPLKTPNDRYITVGKLYFYYTPRKDAPSGTTNCSVQVPSIQIQGRWLNEVGFTTGTLVRVLVNSGCLMLMPQPQDDGNDDSGIDESPVCN
jgi:hypothetical protein